LLQGVIYLDEHVLSVEVVAIVIGELEGESGVEPLGVAGAVEETLAAAELLGADLGEDGAGFGILEVLAVSIDAADAVRDDRSGGVEIDSRGAVVVVAEKDLPGNAPVAEGEAPDELALEPGVAGESTDEADGVLLAKAERLDGGLAGVGGGEVAEDDDFAILELAEEVEDPLVLEKAGDEVEIGLFVLGDVLARRVGTGRKGELEILGLQAGVQEDLLDDLRDGAVEEDSALEIHRKSGETRKKDELEEDPIVESFGLFDGRDDAVIGEGANAARGGSAKRDAHLDGESGGALDDGGSVHILLSGEKVEFEAEGGGELFVAVDADDFEGVGGKGGGVESQHPAPKRTGLHAHAP